MVVLARTKTDTRLHNCIAYTRMETISYSTVYLLDLTWPKTTKADRLLFHRINVKDLER